VQAIVIEKLGGPEVLRLREETFPLAEAAQAHRLIEARATRGSTLLVP
jgi:hypothetical protein